MYSQAHMWSHTISFLQPQPAPGCELIQQKNDFIRDNNVSMSNSTIRGGKLPTFHSGILVFWEVWVTPTRSAGRATCSLVDVLQPDPQPPVQTWAAAAAATDGSSVVSLFFTSSSVKACDLWEFMWAEAAESRLVAPLLDYIQHICCSSWRHGHQSLKNTLYTIKSFTVFVWSQTLLATFS